MREIPLGGSRADGRVAVVDDADYELASRYAWYADIRATMIYARAYSHSSENGKRHLIYMHKLLTGSDRTDHIDGDGLNNQRANLRAATRSENAMNSRPRSGTSSSFKGVAWHSQTQRWRAYITANGTMRHIGMFDTEIAAARARDSAALSLHGAFARLNFPLPTPTALCSILPGVALLTTADLERDDHDAWLEQRRSGIGSSDIPAILGLDPYKDALAIYHAKQNTPGHDRRSSRLAEAARFGHLLEEVIATEFSERTGLRILPSPGILSRKDLPWMRASPDRFCTARLTDLPQTADDLAILEIKTRSAYQAAEWAHGPADATTIQLQWQLAVTGLKHGYIAALIGGNHLEWYQVARDDELIDMMIKAAQEFRERLTEGNPPAPDGSARTSGMLDGIWKGTADLVREFPAETILPMITEVSSARKKAKEVANRLVAAENALKVQMGEAEIGMADGLQVCTWVRNGPFRSTAFADAEPELADIYAATRPSIDTRRLAADHPEVYNNYRSRVLRITLDDGEGKGI